MITKIWICMLAGAALWAAEKPAPQAAARAKAPQKAAPAAAEIPAGAVQTDAQTWKYTAPDGRKWVYSKTPFGIMRGEEKSAPAAAAATADEFLKAVEDGDAVRFERPSPFGVMKWTRKKTELNETERLAWERARTGATAAKAGQE